MRILRQILLNQTVAECPDKAPFVVLYYIWIVVSNEFRLEVCQVEATIIVNWELISQIKDYFVAILLANKSQRKGWAKLIDLNKVLLTVQTYLIVRRHKLIKCYLSFWSNI